MRFFKFYIIFSLLILVSCSTNTDGSVELNLNGSFDSESLNQRIIFEIKAFNNMVYAGTDDNMYRKKMGDSNWQPLGLDGGKVQSFAIFTDNTFLASLNIGNRDSLTIAKTTNTGQAWVPFRNGYSEPINRRIPIEIIKHPSNNSILAGGPGGGTIAKSISHGNHWELLYGTWEDFGFLTFLKISDFNSNVIWGGGSNGTFQPAIIKSVDNGKSWTYNVIFDNVETTVYDVETHPSDADRVLAGLGGGVLKSTDGGKNWQTVLEGVNIYSMTKSTKDERIVYAAGEVASGRPAFFASGDFGNTWQQVTMSDGPQNLYVNDIVSILIDGREVLYLGTTQGVYSYTFAE